MTVFLESLSSGQDEALAGIMMRSNATQGSAYAAVVATPSKGIRFRWRSASGVMSEALAAGGVIQAPVWLRLTRSGNTVIGNYSYDGENWLQLGEPQPVALSNSALAGLCLSSDQSLSPGLKSAAFSHLSLTLPRWSSRDIGSPAMRGWTEFDGETMIVHGGGTDIYGNSDQFHFASQTTLEDVTVLARVEALTESGPHAKSGVMVRESKDPASSYAFLFVKPGGRVGFEFRNGTGRPSGGFEEVEGVPVPCQLALVRSGNTFTAYYSTDGAEWIRVGEPQVLPMEPTVQAGLAVSANNHELLNRTAFTDVAVLPTGWTSVDLGQPAIRGSVSYDGLNWVVSGGGSRLWDTGEQFHFTSRDYLGDVTLVARMERLQESAFWPKAGLMMRDGLGPNASYAYVFMTPDGVGFTGRSREGGPSVALGLKPGVEFPQWLKLVRRGGLVTAYHSANGQDWIELGGKLPVSIGEDARIGLAVNAVGGAALNSATFRYLDYGPNDLKAPFLKQNGIHLRNDYGAGDIVPLRGTNLGGWIMHETWFSGTDRSGLPDAISVYDKLTERFGVTGRNRVYAAYRFNFVTTRDLDLMREWGINCIRLPFWWANVYESGGAWRGEAFTHLDWFIDEAWKRGIYTILDYHGVPGGAGAWPTSGDRRGTYFATPGYHPLVGESWQKIAAHFEGHPGVAGYDLLNEPGAVWDYGAEALRSHMNFLYHAVRDGDPDHTVFIGTWGPKGPANYEWLVDPKAMGWSNVSYKIHLYAEGAASHDVSMDAIRSVADYGVGVFKRSQAAGWNVPTLVGEFGGGRTPEHYAYQRRVFSESGMSWTNWFWKNAVGKAGGEGADMGDIVPNPEGWFPLPDLQHDSMEQILNAYRHQRTDSTACVENPVAKAGMGLPTSVDDWYRTAAGSSLSVSFTDGVLANDLSPHAKRSKLDAVLVDRPEHGRLSLSANGSFLYKPESGFIGTDRFRYRVADPNIDAANIATVYLRVDE